MPEQLLAGWQPIYNLLVQRNPLPGLTRSSA